MMGRWPLERRELGLRLMARTQAICGERHVSQASQSESSATAPMVIISVRERIRAIYGRWRMIRKSVKRFSDKIMGL
jgi:hypothetical protein